MASWEQVLTRVKDPSVFKAYLKQHAGYLLRVIPLTFLISSLIHICWMAFGYDGFNVSFGGHVIGRGNLLWGTAQWSVVPFFLFFGVGMARAAGVPFVMGQLQKVPGSVGVVVREVEAHITERVVQEWLLLYIGGSALASVLFGQRYGPHGTLLAFAVLAILGAALAVRIVPPSRAKGAVHQQPWFVMLCVGVGLAVGAIGFGALGWILLVGGIYLRWSRIAGRKPPSQGMKMAFWFLFWMGWWVLSQDSLWADDGGWKEFKSEKPDGALWDWATDEGGRGVIAYGAGAGAAAATSGAAGDYAGYTAGQTLGGKSGSVGGGAGKGAGGPWTVSR